MKRFLLVAGLLLGLSGTTTARSPVDLDVIDDEMAGPRTQVLVLGTYHLAEHAGEFDPASLEPLLQRLEAFAPDVITIEQVPGEQCDMVMRHPQVYSVDDWKARWCFDTAPARAATGLDLPAAIARMHAMLGDWPQHPMPAQRRELAAVFLAAGDPSSALVQWLQLDADGRRAGDGLDQALVDLLAERARRSGEVTLIAARLASRLGLARLHPVDDHTGDDHSGDDGFIGDGQAYGAAIQAAWDTRGSAVADAMARGLAALRRGDMLEAYRHINAPAVLQTKVEADFGANLAHPSPEGYGRFYVGGWEIRNLRMVANIGKTFRGRPGARVLTIVGGMHKPWFDTWLGQMQGVDIVDVQEVLR